MSDAHALTLPPVTAPVTSPLPEDLSVPRIVALARDLAMDMFELPILLKKHGLTEAQYNTLQAVPYFQQVVKNLAEEWNQPKNAQQRLAVQTAVGLEEVLPAVIARAKVNNEPLQGVAQLVKVLADIAGASGQMRQQTTPGEKFKITIDLGGHVESVEKTKPAITIEAGAPPADARDIQPEVQALSEGIGSLLAIRTEPEKT